MREQGGQDGVMQVAKLFVRVCAQNYFGARIIAPSRGPMICPSLVTVSTGEPLGKCDY